MIGNATRYNPKVRVFPNLNENISLSKTFPIKERFQLDFRAEAFNLLNRVVFGNPQANLNSNAFGRSPARPIRRARCSGAEAVLVGFHAPSLRENPLGVGQGGRKSPKFSTISGDLRHLGVESNVHVAA